MRIATVVLAAGEGRRMGGPKALLPFAGSTFLGHVCALFAAADCQVIAVLGAHAERVRREAGLAPGVVVALNERWAEGMLSSILCGLDAAEAGQADCVLVHPVDNPLVSPTTIAAVIGAAQAGAAVAVPVHDGRRGHPAAFAHHTWTALRQAPPDRGARHVLAQHPEWIVHVPAGRDCLCDLDTPADLAAAVRP